MSLSRYVTAALLGLATVSVGFGWMNQFWTPISSYVGHQGPEVDGLRTTLHHPDTSAIGIGGEQGPAVAGLRDLRGR
jgi:hypothetical protein